MNESKENKADGRNFKFLQSADAELERRSKETGKTMTAVLEDLLLGRRQFRPDIERFIAEQMEIHKKPRNEIIEAALYVAMKFASGQIPEARDFSVGAQSTMEMAVGGSSDAIRLAQESGKKQKAESPSENRPLRGASGRANRH